MLRWQLYLLEHKMTKHPQLSDYETKGYKDSKGMYWESEEFYKSMQSSGDPEPDHPFRPRE